MRKKASEICGREIKLKITVKDPNKGAMISEPLPGPANTFPEEEKAPKSIDEIATKCGLHSGLTLILLSLEMPIASQEVRQC